MEVVIYVQKYINDRLLQMKDFGFHKWDPSFRAIFDHKRHQNIKFNKYYNRTGKSLAECNKIIFNLSKWRLTKKNFWKFIVCRVISTRKRLSATKITKSINKKKTQISDFWVCIAVSRLLLCDIYQLYNIFLL